MKRFRVNTTEGKQDKGDDEFWDEKTNGDAAGHDRTSEIGRNEEIERELIFIDDGEEEGEKGMLTKSQRKELKRQKNLEWKWKRGDIDPNPRHTEYYRQQLPELAAEWTLFQETMARDLPVTFHLCPERNEFVCSSLKSRLLGEFRRMRGRFITVHDTIVSEVVTPITWCPNSWQINCDSSTLAKDEAFSPLYTLLTREVKLSHVVRQELVSMIPAILLDPHDYHFTLDMCAAPGSKTEQLISKVCQTNSPAGISSGLVVANDADSKRLATLRRRYESCRYPNLIFTCAKADELEKILHTRLSFDRVLCDVPCTGDGTFRKSPHLWRLFRPRFAVELHPLQLDIARCGVKLMMKSHTEGKNCRLVYSTCSLNPIEDEAVVVALLMEFWSQGINLQLIEPSALLCDDNSTPLLARHLPGIRWRHGISSWSSDIDTMLAGEYDSKEREESRLRLPPLSSSMRCPQTELMKKTLCLERCMRIFPQDMNTGGFFIAILEISPSPLSESQIEALKCELKSSGGFFADPEIQTTEKKRKKKRSLDSFESNQLTGEKKVRSMKTFQALGYNPHQLSQENSLEWRCKSEAFGYSRLQPSEVATLLEPLGCSLPNHQHLHIFLEEALSSPLQNEKKSKHASNSKKQSPSSSFYLSILSQRFSIQ